MKLSRTHLGCLLVTVMLFASQAYGQGTIEGSAQIKLDDGSTAAAKWIRVLLTTSPADIPATPDFSGLDQYSRMEKIRDLHMAFFISIREEMDQSGYLANSTLTTPDGTFRFSDIAPGKYFIVVTFPAMIDAYKVAWQIPVQIKQDEVVSVVLNNQNMAFPTYNRSKK